MTPAEIGQLVGGGIAAAAAVWGYWKKIRPKLRERAAIDTLFEEFDRTDHIRQQLVDFTAETGSMRTLCLKASNGGLPWPIDSTIIVRCLDQRVALGVENTKKRWSRFEIDGPYRDWLEREVLPCLRDSSKVSVLLRTDRMPAQELRDAYEHQGTCASVVFPLKLIPETYTLIYYSFNFGRQPVEDKSGHRLPIPDDEAEAFVHQAELLQSDPEAVRRMVARAHKAWRD